MTYVVFLMREMTSGLKTRRIHLNIIPKYIKNKREKGGGYHSRVIDYIYIYMSRVKMMEINHNI